MQWVQGLVSLSNNSRPHSEQFTGLPDLGILADYDFDTLLLSHGKNTMTGAKEKVLKLIEACA